MKSSLKNKILNYIAMGFIFSPCLVPFFWIKWLVSDIDVKLKIIGLILLVISVPIMMVGFGVLFMCFFATCFFFKDVFDWTFYHKLNSSQDRDKWLSETFSDVHKFFNKWFGK